MSSDCAQPALRNLYWKNTSGRPQRMWPTLTEQRKRVQWSASYFVGMPGYASTLSGPIIGPDRHANGVIKSKSLPSVSRLGDQGVIRRADTVAHRYGPERTYARLGSDRFGVPLAARSMSRTLQVCTARRSIRITAQPCVS